MASLAEAISPRHAAHIIPAILNRNSPAADTHPKHSHSNNSLAVVSRRKLSPAATAAASHLRVAVVADTLVVAVDLAVRVVAAERVAPVAVAAAITADPHRVLHCS
jgi:hypothetical protein